MSTSIAQKLKDDLGDALEELSIEYDKILKSAEVIEKMLQGSFDKASLRKLCNQFNTSWVEDKLNDVGSVIDDVKTKFNL
jgi:hypothetical protein